MPDATERKILVMCAFTSACLLLAPQEFRSAGALFVLALLMLFAHLRITDREERLLSLLEQWAPTITPPASPLPDAPEPIDVDGEVSKEPP
jgi:hypothetical protein